MTHGMEAAHRRRSNAAALCSGYPSPEYRERGGIPAQRGSENITGTVLTVDAGIRVADGLRAKAWLGRSS